MPSKSDSYVISSAVLQRFTSALFGAAGVAPAMANEWAKSLVWANLRGVDSHGVLRIPGYLERLKTKAINPTPDMRVERRSGAIAVLEADRAPGAVAMAMAMEEAIARAREVHVGWCAARNITHAGAVGYFALQAASAGMAGIVMSASGPMMAYRCWPSDTLGHSRTENPCVVPIPRAYLAQCPAVSRTHSDTPRQVVCGPPVAPREGPTMAKLLTEIAIRNLKPRAIRYEVGDAGARCLRVIVHPSGVKSYVVRYTNAAGRRRKLTLPTGTALIVARKLAADAVLEAAQGNDPAAAKQAAKYGARSRADDTVERLADDFIERHAKAKTRENSWRATAGIFRRIIQPAWGKRSVHEIRRRDVIALLEEVASDRPIMANRTKAALSRFFRWLADRDVIEASPCIGIAAPAQEQAGERVLNDGELVRLWRATEAIGGREGACYRLLMLTALRKSEAAKLPRAEVDGSDMIAIGAARMKGKRAHTLPLSTQAAAIIAAQARGGKYVWGDSPIGHFDRIKRELDAHMGDTPKWKTHDIRRSVASGMARIGIDVPVIEKILAHRKGTFAGVVGVYQRHGFFDEMAVALQRWADHVEQLVTGKSAKVVKLPRRR